MSPEGHYLHALRTLDQAEKAAEADPRAATVLASLAHARFTAATAAAAIATHAAAAAVLSADVRGGQEHSRTQPWVVARDGGRHCVRCEREIRRGEAYEVLAGVDELRHIHCPDPSAERG